MRISHFWDASFLFVEVIYRWTWIWRTQWDQENWSVICKICHMHMTDSVRHMQLCTYAIVLGTSFDRYKSQRREEICLAERNWALVLVSAGISRLLDTCLSGIHNATYIVNSIVCAVILVRGSRVLSYGIRPTHGPIHVFDMHGTWTKHMYIYMYIYILYIYVYMYILYVFVFVCGGGMGVHVHVYNCMCTYLSLFTHIMVVFILPKIVSC